MKELVAEGDDSSLLAKFVHIAKYFNPRDQLDKSSIYARKTIEAEKIFAQLIYDFNPMKQHQDCHEFLVLILDQLHEEMALIHQTKVDKSIAADKASKDDSEWQEVGEHNLQKKFNNSEESLAQASLVRDIFGGLLRTELHVEGSKHLTVTFEPFFALNLEISNKYNDIESCLSSYFGAKPVDGYKLDDKPVKAYH